MDSTTATQRQPGHIHIDRITVNGLIEHEPLGELFFRWDPAVGVVPAGASAYTPKRRKNPLPDDVYIKSSDVQDNKLAYRLLFNCCPPQILQGHNVFGHGDLLDYTYAIFTRQLEKHGLTATPEEHELWRTGRLISVSEVHLTGNFWIEPHLKAMFLNAIDEANKSGKHRDIESCISLGWTGSRRSTHYIACIYDKHPLLLKQWKKPGVYRGRLIELADGSIRIELRLYEGGLAYRGLKSAASWAGLDVDALFFELLAGFNVGNAIQPLLTADEKNGLSKTELVTYTMWLLKQNLSDFFSASTISRHSRRIKEETGSDITGNRRPERLPQLDLSELLCPANIVAVPDWLVESGRYWAPARAQ
jgi:hypothetical protein